MDLLSALSSGGSLLAFGSSVFYGAFTLSQNIELRKARLSSVARLYAAQTRGRKNRQISASIKPIFNRAKNLFSNGEQQIESFERAVISFADELSDALGSGKSFTQGLAEAEPSKDKVLKNLLNTMSSRIIYGESPEKVFKEVSATADSVSFNTLGTAIFVQYGAGGNLRELLSDFAAQQREQLLFRQNLKTQTAQGRLSVKIVGFVPPAMLGAMSLLMPGYLDVFFTSTAGKLMLITALGLDGVGFFLVYRLMRVPI